MHLNEKLIAVTYGENVTLHFNGWDVSGKVQHVTSNHRVLINGKYYSLRACTSITSDYDRDAAIANENRIRREGGILA